MLSSALAPLLGFIGLTLFSACGQKTPGETISKESAVKAPPAPTVVKPAAGPYQPNELGRIMVLEYHLIASPEGTYKRTPENLRGDLEDLYRHNYYPVRLSDVVNGTINIPAGKSPFVLTFDDSSQGQFRYLVKNGQLVIDPDCAVGIMEEFKHKYHDFPVTATFYLLPAIKKGLRLFGQEEYIDQKLKWLVKNNYDLGSHTYYHQNLSRADDAHVQMQLAMAIQAIEGYVPGYKVTSMALPQGFHAKNRALEVSGQYNGFTYRHQSVMLAFYKPSVSPYDVKFNPYAIERVMGEDSPVGPHALIKHNIKHPLDNYVSDGDPKTITLPQQLKDHLKPGLAQKYHIVYVEEAATHK